MNPLAMIKGVVHRQVYVCPCCRSFMKTGVRRGRYGYSLLTLDHIKPRSEGGSNDPENLRPMCKQCNERLPSFQQCIGALAAYISITDTDTWRTSPLSPRHEKGRSDAPLPVASEPVLK